MRPCRHKTLDMSHITSSLTQASTSTMMLQELVVSTTLTLCTGNLARKWKEDLTSELSNNLRSAFEKAVNFEPRILTKQCINIRQINEGNHIDVSSDYHDFELSELHVRNPNYRGKNYDPNYQKNK